MGGKVSIECAKTGYSATLDFLTKVDHIFQQFPNYYSLSLFSFNSHLSMEENIKFLAFYMNLARGNFVALMVNGMV